ncbi:uncharacterized protein N7473_004444 [Penicillium subrubescens]|uniref:uncharacterized protein n=1 Tax=Penicillium subrubescens TaxID=1316194 RepID=UPI00254512A3|nr:uncharacterized protein N7473_004444 [Penicillium subrubescens]KAJ5900374.1 hypothetical protein N7473_004444 [Penicillium subrubescens]
MYLKGKSLKWHLHGVGVTVTDGSPELSVLKLIAPLFSEFPPGARQSAFPPLRHFDTELAVYT